MGTHAHKNIQWFTRLKITCITPVECEIHKYIKVYAKEFLSSNKAKLSMNANLFNYTQTQRTQMHANTIMRIEFAQRW